MAVLCSVLWGCSLSYNFQSELTRHGENPANSFLTATVYEKSELLCQICTNCVFFHASFPSHLKGIVRRLITINVMLLLMVVTNSRSALQTLSFMFAFWRIAYVLCVSLIYLLCCEMIWIQEILLEAVAIVCKSLS